MESYGKILLIAMPIFLLLVLFEKWVGWRKGNDTVNWMDMISSLSSGITNVTKDVLGLSIGIISYHWMLAHFALTNVSNGWITYFIAFLALDFSGYWVHRIQHEYNIFWNAHIVHHSSEEYNLACALRQSISVFIRLFTFFLLPAALLGVSEKVIAITAPIHLFAQFWYHTRHIQKMGFLEKIIVTPSHHRVHHAINPEYIDKNYSQIFIIWDKLFGTFQEEKNAIPAVYGITRPVSTWNPIKINFQHMILLVQDAWNTKKIKDKCKIWFMPTGWRPEDVREKYPIQKIEDVYHFNKYQTIDTASIKIWSTIQILATLLLISYLFGNIAYIQQLSTSYIFLYGLFIFIKVYAYTDLMDLNFSGWWIEVVNHTAAILFIVKTGDWFGIDQQFNTKISSYLIVYFILSSCITFLIYHSNKSKSSSI